MKLINVIKPTHICNLNCDYCFNDDIRQPIMNSLVLEKTIKETFLYAKNKTGFSGAEFVWHGGEPLIAGLKYFKHAIALQKEFSEGFSFSNSIQTNGLLLNQEWVNFFHKNEFSVSLSLDGPPDIHNQYRKDHSGRGSFNKVMNAIKLLRSSDIEPGVVLVATQALKGQGKTVYKFFVENSLRFQIVALTKSGSARDVYEKMALSQADYAELWIEMFDAWFDSNPGYVRCQEFEGRLSAVLSGNPSGCEGLAICADTNISTDPIGDVYSCATFSGTTALSYGNILNSNLEKLMNTDTAVHFRSRKVDPQCSACRWQHICHGGCMSRAYKIFDTIDVRDSGCEALWKTWDHIAERIEQKGLAIAVPYSGNLSDEFSLLSSTKYNRKPLRKVIPIKLKN